MSAQELVEAARHAALEAGRAIMRVYAGDFDVTHKADSTPCTEADLASERIIIAALTAMCPEIPVIAEETCASEGVPSLPARFWAVDPLDGTKEFIARNGEFAVSIGLVEEGRPVLGVVHGPAVGLTYAAHGPGTARRWRSDNPGEPIVARDPDPAAIVVVHSRSHASSPRLDRYFEGRSVTARRVCGSALKFGVLAAGDADLYPRFGPTMEWDTAGGQAVLEAAGGGVFAPSGEPLGYGKPGLKNDGFIAWGRQRLW